MDNIKTLILVALTGTFFLNSRAMDFIPGSIDNEGSKKIIAILVTKSNLDKQILAQSNIGTQFLKQSGSLVSGAFKWSIKFCFKNYKIICASALFASIVFYVSKQLIDPVLAKKLRKKINAIKTGIEEVSEQENKDHMICLEQLAKEKDSLEGNEQLLSCLSDYMNQSFTAQDESNKKLLAQAQNHNKNLEIFKGIISLLYKQTSEGVETSFKQYDEKWASRLDQFGECLTNCENASEENKKRLELALADLEKLVMGKAIERKDGRRQECG